LVCRLSIHASGSIFLSFYLYFFHLIRLSYLRPSANKTLLFIHVNLRPSVVNKIFAWNPAMKRAAMLLALALLSGCTKTYPDPISVMDATAVDFDDRFNASQQAAKKTPTDPRRIAALNNILWHKGYTHQEQVFAALELIKYDEANFRVNIRRWANLIGSYDILEPIYKEAVARQWTDFTPTMVRYYARPVHGMAEADRPESKYLEQLNPGKTAEQVIFEVFADAKDTASPEERTAAWTLLNRIGNPDRVRALLAAAPQTTPLVIDLHACLTDLKTYPRDKEGVIWLMYLRDPQRKAWWDNARAAVAKLNAEQIKGLELRHLTAVTLFDNTTLATDRATLARQLAGDLAGAEHFINSPTYDGQNKDYPQSLRENADKLCWADLAVIRTLLNAVRQPAITSALFEQAEADLKDTTSEHGGALLTTPTGFEAKAFAPQFRTHNLKFVASQAMFDAIYTGLAHYHFHAQEYNNRDFAGPGAGDLDFATGHRMNCLVFTFVGRGRLNVDYYQAGGIVIDLGTIGAGK
jgi:hypothetical protein